MSLETSQVEGVLVAKFTDAKILDETKIQQIAKAMMDLVPQATEKKLLLDFSGVLFMSSAMIGKLVLFNKKCQGAEVQLKMCCIDKNLMDVFKITRLDKVFGIYADQDKAVKAFNKKGWFG